VTRDLDIVLFGATGFVGRLTAAYLAEHAPEGVRVGLAGRSQYRLEALRRQLPRAASDWPIVVADASEPASLAALAERTKVVATTVGPYARSGMPMVEACAMAGTHYADLTGEILFVRDSADAWHETARDTGARIVHSCGFDSIPSDLGVLVTADAAAAAGDGELTRTVLSVTSFKGSASGGTIDSMRQQAMMARADSTVRALLADPYALSPDRAAEPSAPKAELTELPVAGPLDRARRLIAGAGRRLPVQRDPETGHWTGPFVMASYNTRIVRRSNALLGWRYGRAFRYREISDFGAGPAAQARAAATSATLLGVVAGMSFEPTRMLLDRVLPKPGEGPDEATRAAGHYRMVIEAQTSEGAAYRTVVGDDRDPGYDSTAVMLSESALALALDTDALPDPAGVLTPATALGRPLVDRLVAQGFTFTCTRQ